MGVREHLAAEDGFSLVELMYVVAILGVVLSALITVSVAGQQLGVRDSEGAQATRDAQTAVYSITRDLRQATKIMPTGSAAGQCLSTATASCIDFLERTRAFDAGGNHLLQRVRIDCTQSYTPPKPDPYSSTYRSCQRFVSSDATVPATVLQATLVLRVLNWSATATFPVFGYRKIDPTATNGWATASASTDTTGSDAQRINVTLQIPSRGESGRIGTSQTLLVQDGAQLRNVLR